MSIEYSSAIISLLNRDNQTTKAVTYPVSQVVLIDLVNGVPTTSRTFIVFDGKWIEKQ